MRCWPFWTNSAACSAIAACWRMRAIWPPPGRTGAACTTSHPPPCCALPAPRSWPPSSSLCAAHGIAMVPQGGNTSMVGRRRPRGAGAGGDQPRPHEPGAHGRPGGHDHDGRGGRHAQGGAGRRRRRRCLLPLSISSEGSAQIGGVLATNAGGNNTVRYGNAREPGAGPGSRAAGRRGVERAAPACARTTPGIACASSWWVRRARSA